MNRFTVLKLFIFVGLVAAIAIIFIVSSSPYRDGDYDFRARILDLKSKLNFGKSENHVDGFCTDKNGLPIRREEVILVGSQTPKKAFITIGISTIKRKLQGKVTSYLERSLDSHLRNLTAAEKDELLIVIFLADKEEEKREWIQARLMQKFKPYFDNDMIHLIYAPERFYSTLEDLPLNYEDSKKRVKWRSKQALDFSFLAYYCFGLGQYYLHLEDDVESDAGYFKQIKGDLLDPKIVNSPWAIRHYWRMGFIGKLIKDKYLKNFADFWRLYYYEMPLDWSYESVLRVLGIKGNEVNVKNSPFTHLGARSSKDNDDILKDKH